MLFEPPRVIKRHTERPNSDSIGAIAQYLDKYEAYLRDVYISAVEQVRNNADLILNEVASIEQTTTSIKNWLENHTH